MCVRQYAHLCVVCLCGNYILHEGSHIVLFLFPVALQIVTCPPPLTQGRLEIGFPWEGKPLAASQKSTVGASTAWPRKAAIHPQRRPMAAPTVFGWPGGGDEPLSQPTAVQLPLRRGAFEYVTDKNVEASTARPRKAAKRNRRTANGRPYGSKEVRWWRRTSQSAALTALPEGEPRGRLWLLHRKAP